MSPWQENYPEFTVLERIIDTRKRHFNLETGGEQSPMTDALSAVEDMYKYCGHNQENLCKHSFLNNSCLPSAWQVFSYFPEVITLF